MGLQDRRVAIIGGGPAGIVSAKWLASRGFEPEIFEQSDDIGGQWNARGKQSGVWPAMRTNTSNVSTCFSDLRHEPGTATYPTNQQVHSYLKRYASTFEHSLTVRLGTRVESIERNSRGYLVRSQREGSRPDVEIFARVVLASGRFNRPSQPHIHGIETFNGLGGVSHTFNYKQSERFRDLRVLVCGCSISALEIASDLAMLGAASVTATYRRQRYIVQKLFAGVPSESLVFNRFAALASEILPREVSAKALKQLITATFGSPEQFGAQKPLPDIMQAGITMSQNFLPLVAEGRIDVKPWIESVDGQKVRFGDGSEKEFDAIIFGTGYSLSLPYLDSELQNILVTGENGLALHNFTFSPELDGLAVVGLHCQIGPGYPVAELQARYIAYTWSGDSPKPTQPEMQQGVARSRMLPPEIPMHLVAIAIARSAGFEPAINHFPELRRALLFGPLTATSFRLSGPDAMPHARARFSEEAAAFGAITSNEVTSAEAAQLESLDRWSAQQRAA